jgi:cell division protein FtsB
MNFKKAKSNSKVLSFVTNIFVLILVPFIIWMLFFDENSYLAHKKYNTEIDDLEKTIQFYKSEISKDKALIKGLKDSLELEKFAREKYLMKRENEDIYIIEFDTLKKE